MSSPSKPVVCIVSLQVQTSFQAVPLGAACVVSSLRADPSIRCGADVRLEEFSLEDASLAALSAERAGKAVAAKIAGAKPAVAGFSVYVWNRTVLEVAAAELKRLVPGVVTFAGGPEVTACPESFPSGGSIPTGRYTDTPAPIPNGRYTVNPSIPFDYVLPGEGETRARELVGAILSGKPVPREVAGRVRAPAEDCAALRSPWLDGTLSASVAVTDCRGALWELSRGCPYRCAYCYESKGDKKVRDIPFARLSAELDWFAKNGVERVFVLDPTYNARRDRALSLLKLIADKAGDIHFNFEARAELLDREMVASFARIPCSLQIGLQSSNEEALRLVNRPTDLKDFSKKIGLLNDAGVVFGLDLMYGLPGDSLSGFRTSLDYALGLYPNNLEIFRLAVLPGTELAERAAELGLKHQEKPPYRVESTPKFSAADLDRAAALARACDIFYTQGRAVTWFLSILRALKLKPSQFLQDFATWLAQPAVVAKHPALPAASSATESDLAHAEAERLQLEFLRAKFREKQKAFLLPAVCDIVALNGAWTRALAEGEETRLRLSYDPEDLFSPEALDVEYFTENAYMETCSVRVFAGPDGPDLETGGTPGPDSAES